MRPRSHHRPRRPSSSTPWTTAPSRSRTRYCSIVPSVPRACRRRCTSTSTVPTGSGSPRTIPCWPPGPRSARTGCACTAGSARRSERSTNHSVSPHRMRLRFLATLPALVIAPAVAVAQIHASEHFTLTQKVSTTTIALEGDRPVARGRTLFGPDGVVKWGEVWTPGANWATTIEVDRDVTVDGHPLPKGKYSLWLTPQAQPTPWSLAFSRATHRFHTRPPGAADEQLRIAVTPEQVGMHMETLTWYMPVVMPDGVTLRLHWGTTSVPIQIGVDMPRLATLPPEQIPVYVGTYKTHITPPLGAPFDVDLVVEDDAGTLKL